MFVTSKMEIYMDRINSALPLSILDILPNPVLVKDCDLKYVWVNQAFETLFSVKREDLVGNLDKALFPDRQVAQCNGGDLRVLDTGDVDESVETVFTEDGEPRETITRKSRLTLDDGQVYLVGVMHDITDVTRTNETLEATRVRLEEQAVGLERLATVDVLTGCSNRRALEPCGRNLFEVPHLYSALLMLDLDYFKSINDSFGHECGDEVLRHLVSVVRQKLCDADYFIRLGGEEFAVCVSRIDGRQIEALADTIRLAVEDAPLQYRGNTVPVTVSIGVATKETGETCTVDEMLVVADANLYAAKTGGRNQVLRAA